MGNKRIVGIVYVLLSVLLWSLIPLVSVLGQSRLDNHQFLFWSSLVSFLTILSISVTHKKIQHLRSYSFQSFINTAFLGFLGTYLYYILLYYGYANTNSIQVIVLQYLWPVFIIILSVLLLDEKVGIRGILSIILGLVGSILIITKGDFSAIDLGDIVTSLIIILAAFVFGLFSVLSKKVDYELYSMLTTYFGTATLISLLTMTLFSSIQAPDQTDLFPILVNGIFVNGISYILWIRALRLLSASFAAPFVFITPVLSTIWAIIFLNEQFLLIYGLGLLAVIASGLLNREKDNTNT